MNQVTESRNKTLITSKFIVKDINEVVLIEVNNKKAVFLGKNNTQLMQDDDFNPELYSQFNFIKINDFTYINPVHITSVNTKYKILQLNSELTVPYETKNELLLLNYLRNISLSDINC